VHILTKILVVFAALLSVMLAALTMAYSVNAQRLSDDYRDVRLSLQQIEASSQSARSREGEESARQTQMIASLEQEKASLREEQRRLEAENGQLETRANQIDSAQQEFRNEVQRWEAMIKTQTALIESYSKEVTKLRDDELRFRRREIELVDRINDIESRNEVLNESRRALQEQLVELQQRFDAVASGSIGAGGGEPDVFVSTGPPVQGQVVKTMLDPATGRLLAEINLGTNEGVRENMRLYIGRGDDFLAHLTVTLTDLTWSVGVIDTLGREIEIQPGDFVTTNLGAN
jgi:hypothetical protein